MWIVSKSPFHQKAPILVAHQHLSNAPVLASLLGKFNGRTHSLRFGGIGANVALAALDDGSVLLFADHHKSRMAHEQSFIVRDHGLAAAPVASQRRFGVLHKCQSVKDASSFFASGDPSEIR
jgi:hypothetical protein